MFTVNFAFFTTQPRWADVGDRETFYIYAPVIHRQNMVIHTTI